VPARRAVSPRSPRALAVVLCAVVLLAAAVSTGCAKADDSAAKRADARLDGALAELVATEGMPPGAIATVYRDGRSTTHAAGVAQLGRDRAPGSALAMRIASVSKAFSGAVALSLVDSGKLDLADTIGRRLPGLPRAWHRVTLTQLLQHTSGVPDFTASKAFGAAVGASPDKAPPPAGLLAFVADEPLNFAPGSQYRYSNSDNVIVGLMAEAVTGESYASLLRRLAYRPAGLRATSLPRGVDLPRPFLHGYAPADAPGGGTTTASTASPPPEDVSEVVAFGGWAWASGGIVSTSADLGRFVRAELAGTFFGDEVRGEQHVFVKGTSEPTGPGDNAAGLALFRYRTDCGTMYGHTGSILGYTQLIAASADGTTSVTFTVSGQVPKALVPRLRRAEEQAVCAALAV